MSGESFCEPERCETCRFWKLVYAKGEPYKQAVTDSYSVEYHEATRTADFSQCRRSPPVLCADWGSGWPAVERDDWCGEYRSAS